MNYNAKKALEKTLAEKLSACLADFTPDVQVSREAKRIRILADIKAVYGEK